jgi:glycosyltransferase involved in cell wall biosynthesis
MKNSHQPLVSVIIPFYNEDTFLPEAVESVLRQTYTHWELFLVDDGSFNASIDIALQYATAYPDKIFYLEHAGHGNKGVSATRNLGIQQSHGDLIAFLDADDVWLPKKLEHQVDIFRKHPGVGLLAEASDYWYSWDGSGKEDSLVPVGVPGDRLYQPQVLAKYLYPLQSKASPCPSALMLSKEAVARVGGFEESFSKELQLYEDQALLSKLYLSEQVYISSACHNLYRKRIGSIEESVKANGQYHLVRKYFLEWYEKYLSEHAIENQEIQKLLKAAFLPYRNPQKYYFTQIFPAQVKQLVKRGMRKLSFA